MSEPEALEYQREVWSKPEVAGYDELVDVWQVGEFVVPIHLGPRMRELANESSTMDAPEQPSKFAIVAPEQFAFGMARMYQTYRELQPRSTKIVGVFRTLPEALSFLSIDTLD